jgi:hypothetical protein
VPIYWCASSKICWHQSRVFVGKVLTSEGLALYNATLRPKTSCALAEANIFSSSVRADKGDVMNKRTLLGVVFFSLVCLLCPLLFCPLVYGQATGSFSGTITDKAGAVISGATVNAVSQETGLTRDTKTDDSGHYIIPLLPVADYTIRVQFQGFQTTEQKNIRLQVDEHREIDFTLVPASVSSTVEVNATEVAVETANSTLGQVITSEQVADLPLNGRN